MEQNVQNGFDFFQKYLFFGYPFFVILISNSKMKERVSLIQKNLQKVRIDINDMQFLPNII